MKLRIKNWDTTFETAKSRTYKTTNRVCTPNKVGLGLSYILSQRDGAAIFGVFKLMVDICSRHNKPRAGWLTHDGTERGIPWTVDQLSLYLRRPVEEIARCVEICLCDQVAWFEDVDCATIEVPRKETAVSARGSNTDTRRIPQGSLDMYMYSDMYKDKEGAAPPESASADSARQSPNGENGKTAHAKTPDFPLGFVQFWTMYPTKGRNSRKKALEIWKRDKLEKITSTVVDGLAAWLRSQRWNEGIICHATTWLNEARWENAPEAAVDPPEGTFVRKPFEEIDLLPANENDKGGRRC